MSVATFHRNTAFQARSLFRSLLRQSSQFSNYNFREYARRKTRDSFREHQTETEERRIQELVQEGLQNLRLLKRQTVISQFYQLDKLVVEGQKTGKETGEQGEIVRQKDTGSSRSGRHLDTRSRTGQIDHDVFEGLPVRRWSRQPHIHTQVPKTDDQDLSVQGPGGGTGLPELQMPRDSQLLPPISRALLRAARAGCIYIRSSGRSNEETEKEGADAEDQAGAGAHMADRSFTSRKWMTLPKHLEPAEAEFLAKRRSGLHSLYGGGTSGDGSSGATPGPMRRTKFKKVDPQNGNISIYEAWVPEGHRIEGEVTGDVQTIAEQNDVTVNSETPAPGTIVEGVGIVNSEGVVVAEASSASVMTPPKRRPPPPKRKGKGIGKGRKKKVMFAPGEGADAATVHNVALEGTGGADSANEGQEGSQMSIDQSAQDDEEDYGEEGDESDGGDESMLDAKTPEISQPPSGTESTDHHAVDSSADDTKDVDMTDLSAETQPSGPESSSVTGPEGLPQAPSGSQTNPSPNEADTATSVTLDSPAVKPEESKSTAEPPADLKTQSGETGPSEQLPPTAPEISETTIEMKSGPKEESPAPEASPATQADPAVASVVTKPSVHKTETDLATSQVNTELQSSNNIEPTLESASPEKPAEATPAEDSTQSALEQPLREQSEETEKPKVSAQEPASAASPSVEPEQTHSSTVAGIKGTDASNSLETGPDPTETKGDSGMGDTPAAPEPQPEPVPAEDSNAQSPKPISPIRPESGEPDFGATETTEPAAPATVPEKPASLADVPAAPSAPDSKPEQALTSDETSEGLILSDSEARPAGEPAPEGKRDGPQPNPQAPAP
ncbi:LYR family protein [Penicillium hispanicum]|uniref:LYR family protein n=1 Tax=Penicillium hispanicum TaxID=1080232 RepID=UPI0025423BDF|nr:LYR family protein [Penicillium hispanicum]KAJ5594482.1 LYR family protein [Penicillium hispanicum]